MYWVRLTPAKINAYTFRNLPSAWWCGVRVIKITQLSCEVILRLNFFNKNPFRSIFWAVQGMAAELSTGVLLMQEIDNLNKNVSMLVIENKAVFTKKAKGKIKFVCGQGQEVKETFETLSESKKPQTIWMSAQGLDEDGDRVSYFEFHWTLKEKMDD